MKNLIIDFDSTFVKIETLEELAALALKDNPEKDQLLRDIEKITKKGMEGRISFSESLSRRLRLFSASKDQVAQTAQLARESVSDSFLENKDFFKENAARIWIISGGFEGFIFPVVEDFGLDKKHVLANYFIFNQDDQVVGVDQNRPLAHGAGKVKAVLQLELNPEETVVIGDGYTDFEIKRAGLAKKFVAFCENVERQNVIQAADEKVKSFDEVLELVG